MPQYQAEKLLKKSKLSTAYGKLDSAELQRAVLEEYEKLLDENDLSNKTLAGHMKGSILPSVAFYRVLPGRGYKSRDAAPDPHRCVGRRPADGKVFPEPWQAPVFLPAVPGDVPSLDEARLWRGRLGVCMEAKRRLCHRMGLYLLPVCQCFQAPRHAGARTYFLRERRRHVWQDPQRPLGQDENDRTGR